VVSKTHIFLNLKIKYSRRMDLHGQSSRKNNRMQPYFNKLRDCFHD